jgi:hypothetical protein
LIWGGNAKETEWRDRKRIRNGVEIQGSIHRVALAIWLKVWIESFNERLRHNVLKENSDVKIN